MTQGYYAVYGMYFDYASLDQASRALSSAGISDSDISLAIPYYARCDADISAALRHTAALPAGAELRPGQVLVLGQLGALLVGNRALAGVLTEYGVSCAAADGYVDGLREGRVLVALYCETLGDVTHGNGLMENSGARQISLVHYRYQYCTNHHRTALYYYDSSDLLRAAGADGQRAYGAMAQCCGIW